MITTSAMRYATSNNRVMYVTATGNPQSAIVQVGATTALGGKKFVGDWIIDNTGNRFAIACHTD